MAADPQSPLNPNGLLESEFDYIAQTAFQANEDRARVTTFYLVNLGGLVAALFSSQLASSLQAEVDLLFGGLFAVLSATGLLTILQLARLRQAWYESVQALDQIKEYYTRQFPSLKLEQAFRWKMGNIPRLYKPWSISFLLVLQIAVLGGVSLGAAAYYFGLLAGYRAWPVVAAAGIIYFIFQLWLHRRLLSKGSTQSESRRMGHG